jgi:cell division protein FtsB
MVKRNQRQQALEWRRRRSWGFALVAGGALGILLVTSFFFDEMGVPRYLAMLRNVQHLEQEIKALERANLELRTEISRLQHDPVRIEELARERLGFVRKGETVFQIVEEPKDERR